KCTAATQCPSPTPMCDLQAGICVGCVASMQTCGADKMCDENTHTCVATDPNKKCIQRSDCPFPGRDPITAVVCLLDAGICVQCLNDRECTAPDRCNEETHLCLVPDAGTDAAPDS